VRVMKCRVLLSTNPLLYLTCTWTDNSGLISSKRYIEITQLQTIFFCCKWQRDGEFYCESINATAASLSSMYLRKISCLITDDVN